MGLDQKAVEAVSRWRFTPSMKEGKPVTVEIAVEVEFHLYGGPDWAIRSLRSKADAGDPKAQLKFADFFLKGKHTVEDEHMAKYYLEKSATQGLPRAQFELAEYLAHQNAPDYPRAFMWYTLAQRGGGNHSGKALKALTAKMTPEQVQQGQTLADHWTSARPK